MILIVFFLLCCNNYNINVVFFNDDLYVMISVFAKKFLYWLYKDIQMLELHHLKIYNGKVNDLKELKKRSLAYEKGI